MAVETSERIRKANSEAKVLLSVILGFTALVVIFMVFMMANAPRGGISCSDLKEEALRHIPANESPSVLMTALPLHPSFPGRPEDCEPSFLQNT